MAIIDKKIMINAPLEKIFNYLLKPTNLEQIWPSLMVIKNEQLLSNGGYSAKWVYKMAGVHLEGTSEYTEIVPNQYFTIKTNGDLKSTITCTFRSKDSQTRVTFTINYQVPLPLLAWLTGNIILKINEHEAELILVNLQTILEES